ncbi:hypothetical protein BV917_07370 [Leptospira santarosai serovar Guaricura]|nr:hypothetical protein BV917_07370 [Leptospira santarosai serovar Guaricura]
MEPAFGKNSREFLRFNDSDLTVWRQVVRKNQTLILGTIFIRPSSKLWNKFRCGVKDCKLPNRRQSYFNSIIS